MQIFQVAVFQNNAVFDFAIAHGAIVMNRSIGTDKCILDQRALANDRRSANFGIDHARPFFQNDAPFQNRIFERAVILRLHHLQHQPIRFQHVADASRVYPRVGEVMRPHIQALVHQILNCVGDFKFAARRGFDIVHGVKHRRSEHVNSNHRIRRNKLLWFLDNFLNASISIHHRDAHRTGVLHFIQNNLRVHRFLAERVHLRHDSAANEIVAKKEDEWIAAEKLLRDLDAMRDTERLRLRNIGDARAELRAIPHLVLHLISRFRRDHDADFGHARFNQIFERVKQNRFIGNRNELLGARVRQGAQACSFSAGEDQPLH